ncbi:hypothetical protein [Spiroplasma endosymbiont of Cantharis nigra]|uniref:hypothetical protein n=1 Tax=Spiroplasma endosymbiont of Cantharis nigra TaxID=3066278 RepID=UPI0030CF35A3
MKKLISVIGALGLSTSSILLTTQVVSCNATWALEFKAILKKDAQSIAENKYFNITSKIDLSNKVRRNLFSLDINSEIKRNNALLKEITNESLQLFSIAKNYFDSMVVIDEESDNNNDYYYYVLQDKEIYGNSSKIMNYESEKNFLDFFGDEIIKPEFQSNAARFAVLKNNLKFTQAYYEVITKDIYNNYQQTSQNKAYIESIQEMNKYVENGFFVPMLKFIVMEKVISSGNSLTKLKFDKSIIEYLNVGQKGEDSLKNYTGYWYDSKNKDTSGILTYNWSCEHTSKSNSELNYIAMKEEEKIAYLNSWRACEDYKGKPPEQLNNEEALEIDDNLIEVMSLGIKKEDGKINDAIVEKDFGLEEKIIIVPRVHFNGLEGSLNSEEVQKFFKYGFQETDDGGNF